MTRIGNHKQHQPLLSRNLFSMFLHSLYKKRRFFWACLFSLLLIIFTTFRTIQLSFVAVDSEWTRTARVDDLSSLPLKLAHLSTEVVLNHPQNTTTATKRNHKPIQLFHVINTYANVHDNQGDSSSAQPYDQWSTLLSIQRAKQQQQNQFSNNNNLEATLVCAVFESDERILNEELAPVCDRISLLERSTATEFGNLQQNSNSSKTKDEAIFSEYFSKRQLPFLQDLLETAVAVARNETNDDFYIMLTNTDIGLTRNFYGFLENLLKSGKKAYTINRWSIPMEGSNITIRTPSTDPGVAQEFLSQIDASLSVGKEHPGFDCFVIHSSIVDQIHLGFMFAGYPPWGGAWVWMLQSILGDSYQAFDSTPNATFHLGEQRTWAQEKADPTSQAVVEYIREHCADDLKDCPKSIYTQAQDPHMFLNAANCGRVARETYNHTGPTLEEKYARAEQAAILRMERRRRKQEKANAATAASSLN